MDRFIAIYGQQKHDKSMYLKSSMDRFIVCHHLACFFRWTDLKSSMDRFIVLEIPLRTIENWEFKIQYG